MGGHWIGRHLMTIASLLVGGAPPLVLSANPPNHTYGSRTGSGTCTSDPVTVTATGGIGAKTYAWTEVTATAAVADSPSSATSTFSATLGMSEELGATFRCTVTDSIGTTATIDIEVFLFEVSYF